MAEGIETFRCVPLASWLTRSACAGRRTETTNLGTKRGIVLRSVICAECPMGAAHAAGEKPTAWASGELVELRVLGRSTEAASLPRLPAAPVPIPGLQKAFSMQRRRASARDALDPKVPDVLPVDEGSSASRVHAPKEDTMAAKVMIEWQGRSQTASDWARELGDVSTSGVLYRNKNGKNPDGSPRDTAAEGASTFKRPFTKAPSKREATKALEAFGEPIAHTQSSDVEALLRVTGIEHQVLARTAAGVTFFVPASA